MKTVNIWTVIYTPTQVIIGSYSNQVDADIFLSKQVDKDNYKAIANKLSYSNADLNSN